MVNGKLISFKENISENQLTKLLKNTHNLKWTTTETENVSMLDSFDGRLFNAGYSLKYANETLIFRNKKNPQKDFSVPLTHKKPPLFSKDIKDENTKILLHQILDVRALITRLTLSLKTKFFNIVNSDNKIIARGRLVTCKPSEPEKGPEKVFCFINPLRGYNTELVAAIKNWPASSRVSNFDRAILKIYDINFESYAKPVFSFNKDMSLSEAFFSILKVSFEIMRKNENGIIDDTDIEFLHDYRVSARRIRSALGLIKNVIKPEMSATLINDLRQIGTVSGPLRDLDVYLLRETEYKELVPESWSSREIHTIFVTLKNRRRRALKNMVTLLKSEEYKKTMSRWDAFFEDYNKHVKKDRPLFNSASALIMKRYKRVLNDGSLLTKQSPDDGFHELRITCKKLRYLLEFFSSLYPAEKIGLAIKQLKKLQDNLGDFNDLSVQIDSLEQFLMAARKKNNTILIQDISGLIAVLNFKKQRLRDEFYSLFKKFSSPENQQLFKEMFANKRRINFTTQMEKSK
ncbi:MAG: CHAD domain-containing protein [Calditrichaeota bacterium]|nr:CHAD domain-containing protein [Calditrichota bacterium]